MLLEVEEEVCLLLEAVGEEYLVFLRVEVDAWVILKPLSLRRQLSRQHKVTFGC